MGRWCAKGQVCRGCLVGFVHHLLYHILVSTSWNDKLVLIICMNDCLVIYWTLDVKICILLVHHMYISNERKCQGSQSSIDAKIWLRRVSIWYMKKQQRTHQVHAFEGMQINPHVNGVQIKRKGLLEDHCVTC